MCCGVLLYCVLPRSLASRLNGDSSVIVAISKQLYINKVKNIQKYFEQNKKLFLALFITASAVHTESCDKTINVVNDLTKKLLDEFCPYRSDSFITDSVNRLLPLEHWVVSLTGYSGAEIGQLVEPPTEKSANTDAGSSPQCGKIFFSQCRRLPVQTLLRCPYSPVYNHMHQHLCAH